MVIGLDPGFGGIKVAHIKVIEGQYQLTTATVPAVVGVGTTDLGLLSLGAIGRRSRAQKPYTVEFEGTSYLVGHNVHRYARPVERMDFHRLAGGPEIQAAVYAALAQVLGDGESTVPILIGLPVEIMAERDLAQEVLRGIRGWLVGEHRFRVDEQMYRVNVTEVRAMPQPAGTFFAWGLNDRGKWVRPKEDLKVPVGIVDIGFNTLDLFAVQNGQVVGQYTGGDTAGIRRATELLSTQVRERYDVRLSRYEADTYLREKRPVLYCAAGAIDLRPLVRQALEVTATAILDFVETRWGNAAQFRHVLFTGGGSALLREWLERRYPHGVVLADPVTANAVGFARYAVRVWGR